MPPINSNKKQRTSDLSRRARLKLAQKVSTLRHRKNVKITLSEPEWEKDKKKEGKA